MSLQYPAGITLKTLEIDGITIEIRLSKEKELMNDIVAQFLFEILTDEY